MPRTSTPQPGSPLGAWMNHQRKKLGITWVEVARRAGVAYNTLVAMRSGQGTRDTTDRNVEDALRWSPFSVDAIREGKEPTDKPETSSPSDDTPQRVEESVIDDDRLDDLVRTVKEGIDQANSALRKIEAYRRHQRGALARDHEEQEDTG